MRNLCFFFLVGLSTGFISEKLSVTSVSVLYMVDDLYIEGQASGDSSVDDEGGDDEDTSGSGSGDEAFRNLNGEEQSRSFLNFADTSLLKTRRATALPQNPPTTAAGRQNPPLSTEDTVSFSDRSRDDDSYVQEVDLTYTPDTISYSRATDFTNLPNEDVLHTQEVMKNVESDIFAVSDQHGKRYKANSAEEVTSENLWERTDVLAAVIACGVVGFLCAVSLLLLLAYRMKKKDEGSYDLGDTKLSATAYQRAPTKEFYA